VKLLAVIAILTLAACKPAKMKDGLFADNTSNSQTPPVIVEPFAASLGQAVPEHAQVAVPDATWSRIVVKNTGSQPWQQNEVHFVCEVSTQNWGLTTLQTDLHDPSFANWLSWPVQPGQTVGMVPVIRPDSAIPRDTDVPVRYHCQLARNNQKFGPVTNELQLKVRHNDIPPPPQAKCEVGPVSVPASELDLLKQIRDANPGMVNDCTGHPIANNFLLTAVRELQKKDCRWGFMLKPDGRIPRDIIAYAWDVTKQGSHNMFIYDMVSSGCNNTPWDPGFEDPQPNANVWWNLLNAADGFAGNGVWTYDP
jgi:hypothetical protein